MIGYLWLAVGVAVGLAGGALAITMRLAAQMRTLRSTGANPPLVDLPAPGTPVPRFQMETIDGAVLTEDDAATGELLLVFLSASCRSCWQELPELRQMVTRAPADTPRPVAIVVGTADERADLVLELTPITRVVVTDDHAGLPRIFGVSGFPAFLIIQDGTVQQSGHSLLDVRPPVRS